MNTKKGRQRCVYEMVKREFRLRIYIDDEMVRTASVTCVRCSASPAHVILSLRSKVDPSLDSDVEVCNECARIFTDAIVDLSTAAQIKATRGAS